MRRFLGAVIALALVSGCGSEDGKKRGDADQASEPSSRTSKPRDPSGRPSPGGGADQRRSERGTRGRQAVPTGAGSAYRLPPPPRRSVTEPGRKCVHTRGPQPPAGRRVVAPPAPGLSAKRAGPTRILVTYRFARLPRSCAPARLKLSVDVSDDTLPGSATSVRVRRRQGSIRLPIPRDLRRADVVRATAYTKRFAQSEAAAVLIR
jgi:hypothetical protein